MWRNNQKNYNVEIDDTILTASRRDVAHMEFRLSKKWLALVFVLMMTGMAVLAARAVYLSIVQGEQYQQKAQSNSMRMAIIPAPRGQILDVNGEELVTNVPQVDAVLVADLIPRDEVEQAQFVDMLAAGMDMSPTDVRAQIAQMREKRQMVSILRANLTQNEIFSMVEVMGDTLGVQLISTARRQYIDSSIFAHILGYTGAVSDDDLVRDDSYYITDYTGAAGIEQQYEQVLRGHHGYKTNAVDALGRKQRVIGESLPVPGDDLYLNIDMALQKKLYDSLNKFATKADSQRAAAVAIDPRDGSVRALVSVPGYDNNLFAGGISHENYQRLIDDVNKPLFNRAIAGTYPPGSTVKPWIAGGALTEGVIDEQTIINSTGSISIGRWKFRDWRVNGLADVRRAIAVSHDIFFYSIGGGYGNITGMGMDTMKKYYELFGMGAVTGIDLPGEARGFIPSAAWKQESFGDPWTIGNDYHASIGQGYITATPLQIANATVAVANGGTLWRPRIAAYQRNQAGAIVSYQPERLSDNLFTPEIMRIIREGTRMTVTEGTAQMLASLPIEVAGKTGTAQFGGSARTHSWFTSYAPYDQPTLVLLVLVEGQSKTSSSATVPVAKEVWQWYAEQNTKDKK